MFEKYRSSEGRSELPILLKVLPAAASVFAICVGVLVLAGWFFDVELLKRVLPGFVAMNPATAFSFIVAGLALALSIRQKRTEAGRRLATTLSAIVLLISLAKLIGIAANWHPNVDEWLFASKLAAAEREMPNRMAPNTAFNFVLVGLSLLTLDVSSRRFSPSQAFAILTGFSALLPVTGYVYGVQSFRGVASFIPMALHTAITFLILAAGIFFAPSFRSAGSIIRDVGAAWCDGAPAFSAGGVAHAPFGMAVRVGRASQHFRKCVWNGPPGDHAERSVRHPCHMDSIDSEQP